MNILVINLNNHLSKSSLLKSIIKNCNDYTIIKIDPIIDTRFIYENTFNNVIKLDNSSVIDLKSYINVDNLVLDIGFGSFLKTFNILIKYELLFHFDKIFLTTTEGKTETKNAIRLYYLLKKYSPDSNILFALMNVISYQLQQQYNIFFQMASMFLNHFEYIPIYKDIQNINNIPIKSIYSYPGIALTDYYKDLIRKEMENNTNIDPNKKDISNESSCS